MMNWLARLLAGVTVAACLVGGVSAAEADDAWKTTLALGVNATDGNSDSAQANIDLTAQRKRQADELLLGARYAYGETSDVITTRNGKLGAQYNRLFSAQWYGYLNTSLSYDDIAELDRRFIFGPGVGYYFFKDKAASLGVEFGVAYIEEKVAGVEDDVVALRLAERYERALSETAKVWQSLEYLPQVDDSDNYLLNFEIGVEATLTSSTNLRVALTDRYDNRPAPGREENDAALNVALVFNL